MRQEPKFIVLEFDEPFASQVIELRQACGDAFRASLPAEITLTGSSGVGELAPEQAIEDIAEVLRDTAANTPAVWGAFGPMLRFPGTDLFVLTVQDETPFQLLHQRLVGSRLQFDSNSFPYRPHCTISSNPVTPQEAERRLGLSLPGPFILRTLAVYGLWDKQVARLMSQPLHA